MEYLDKALRVDPHNTEVRKMQVDWLIDNDQLADARDATFALARVHQLKDELAEAIKLLEESGGLWPEDSELLLLLGDLYSESNRIGKATDTYKRAAEIARNQAADERLIEIDQRILELEPDNIKTRKEITRSLFAAGNEALAVEHCAMLVDQHIQRQQFEQAEAEARRILEYQPEHLSIMRKLIEIHQRTAQDEELTRDYMRMARTLQSKGMQQDAVKLLREALQVEPGSIGLREMLIEIYMEYGDERKLIDDYMILAKLLQRYDRKPEAARYLRSVLKLEANHTPAETLLTQLGESAEEPQDETAKKLRPIPVDAEREVPTSFPDQTKIDDGGQSDDMRRTIQRYQMILEQDPRNLNVREKLGDCYQQNNQIARAVEQWEIVSEEYEKLQDYDETIMICEKIMGLRPNNLSVRKRLSNAMLCNEAMGALDSAISTIRRRPATNDPDATQMRDPNETQVADPSAPQLDPNHRGMEQ